MKAFIKGILLLVMVCSLIGCSRKKNNFLNRNWHAVTAKYNTLYNGNLALEQGKEELKANYFDNYWDILPVERMQVNDEVMLPGKSENPNFEIAEEKAVKAIQRHSMLIDNKEKNPQIDEAYLLLGKARYYDQRFIPALEAFNYILHKYPLSNTINQAKIWREKANIRLEFEELAINNLKKVLDQELKDQDRADASAILAQAYINLAETDSAIAPIKQAAEFTKKNEEKGRYFFIKGQLYNELGLKDSANLAFDEVIKLKRKSPRIYMINAYVSRMQNLSEDPRNEERILELLTDLEEDRENRPFLDKIYFQLAEFHYQRDSFDLATEYYNKSLRAPSDDTYLQSLNYQTLGNLNFDDSRFKTAGAYYDSTLLQLPENSREFRSIKKKRDNLDDVIYYEDLARTNDSILYLADMSEDARLKYFTNYTDQLKAEGEKNNDEQENGGIGDFGNSGSRPPGVPNPGNAFYFYNPTTVAYGKQEFERTWGDRRLADNWRTERSSDSGRDISDSKEESSLERNPMFDPITYISQIPDDPEVLDSLVSERNFANYQLGLIYRDKFEQPGLAAEKLERLLDSNPEERLVLPAMYNLYKIYEDSGDSVRAAALKNEILNQFPDSRYAVLLKDTEGAIEDENSPEVRYTYTYSLFENQKFEEVIDQTNEMVRRYSGEQIIPKFELLKAMAIGRLMGFEAYKRALNEVALNYPQTEEGKKAERLFSEALPTMANDQFQEEDSGNSFKLIFPLKKSETEEAEKLQKELEKARESLNYTQLEISRDVYNPEEIFVVVHGFRSPEGAHHFSELLSKEKDHRIEKKSFYISTPNYRIAQIHKNIETYLYSNN